MEDTFEINQRLPIDNIGWLDTRLPKSAMTILQNYIEVAKLTPKPLHLCLQMSTHVSKSLILKDKDNWFFQNILLSFIDNFLQSYPSYLKTLQILTADTPFCLSDFWVNFQKQHEFQPPHNHNGIFSFVIWVKIPTDWKEQHTYSNNSLASDFQIQYTSILGEIVSNCYHLDKESEGGMVFFPSKLTHQVFPFYNCDKERISISGNIRFDTGGPQCGEQ